MSPKGKLASLLVAVGTIGALVVFVPKPGVTTADLMDAGLDQCAVVGIECPVLRTTWADGGNGPARMLLEGHLCDSEDGGKYLVHLEYWDTQVTNWGACGVVPADGGWPKVVP